MAVYKFRLTFEDYEDIYRDIEIRSTHTFFDFHEIILQSIGFDMKHAASFFASDDFWRKGTEITLLEEDLEPGVKLMKNTKNGFKRRWGFSFRHGLQLPVKMNIQFWRKRENTSGSSPSGDNWSQPHLRDCL